MVHCPKHARAWLCVSRYGKTYACIFVCLPQSPADTDTCNKKCLHINISSKIISKLISRRADSTDSFDYLVIRPYHPSNLLSPLESIQFFIGQPTLLRLCVGMRWRTSFMSSSLLHQQYAEYLARFSLMLCEIGGKWQYSYCIVGCYFQDL